MRRFLKHNSIENPNQGKAAFRLLKDVPANFVDMTSSFKSLAVFQARLPEEFSSLFMSGGSPIRDSQRSDDSAQDAISQQLKMLITYSVKSSGKYEYTKKKSENQRRMATHGLQ